MREAVIVSTARTPLTKAHRGEFNITAGADASFLRGACSRGSGAYRPGAHRGCRCSAAATRKAAPASNIAPPGTDLRRIALSIAGATVNRFCASGLQAIAVAAGRIVLDGAPAMIAGGVESISGIRF